MTSNINMQKIEEWKPTKNPWLVTIAVMIGTFISILDSTIANVALPHMAGSLSATNEEAMWILTSYLIASGVILPSVDWFSKVFGRRNYYIACIAIFTIASVFCGLSKSLDQMILSRIIQGIGGGALMPISQAIMLESFPKEKRGMSMSIFGVGILVAPIIGPLVGGWITDSYSWHWIFYINIPFGIIAIIASKLWIEDPPYAQKQGFQKIDYIGFGLLIIWLSSLQVFLDKGNNADWFNSTWVCWTAALSVFSMIGFFVSQLIRKNTIIDLYVFKDKNYAVGTLLLTVIMGVIYASMAIMPLFLQNLLGYTAFLSGWAIMPRGIGCIIAIIITGVFAQKMNYKLVTILGLVLLGISCLMLGNLSLQISMVNIILPNLIMGLSMGFCMMPLTTLSIKTLENHQMTNATGIQSLLKETGGAIGMSIVATLLSRYGQMHQCNMVGHLHNLNPAFQIKFEAAKNMLAQYMHVSLASIKANYLMYAELLKQSNLWAFIDAFRVFGLIALVIIPLVFLLDENKKESGTENISVMH